MSAVYMSGRSRIVMWVGGQVCDCDVCVEDSYALSAVSRGEAWS